MSEKKTLRDEIAMSMPTKAIPTLQNTETIRAVSEKYGIEWGEDPLAQIKWSLKYQAIIRYEYADAMMEVRG